MNELINSLVGKRVVVESGYGQTGYTDSGILEGYDDPWLKLRKNNGDTLYFSVYRIRIVKLLP